MMKIKRIKLGLLFVMLHAFGMSQTTGYQYQANIDRINASGFYNIVLTPQINAHLKTDYRDLRIVNDSGKWIPHVVWAPNEHYNHEAMFSFVKIIKKETTIAFTDLITEAVDSLTHELVLEIKNTLAERYCTLTGSDNLSDWFIINDSIVIRPEKNTFTGNSNFTIKFPPVSYKYFKIRINNNGREPFNIINVQSPVFLNSQDTHPGGKRAYSPATENPACTIAQKDSGDRSYIRIIQPAKYHFDKIGFKLSGAKYYNRKAELYFPTAANHSFSNPGELKESIVLSNNSTLEFRIPVSNPVVFYLIILNEDNPPIKVESVKTYRDCMIATAWLEKTANYTLIMDNATANPPKYDLELKDIVVQGNHPVVAIDAITQLPRTIAATKPVTKNNPVIWALIALAVLVLGFFTWKLITDMNKSKA